MTQETETLKRRESCFHSKIRMRLVLAIVGISVGTLMVCRSRRRRMGRQSSRTCLPAVHLACAVSYVLHPHTIYFVGGVLGRLMHLFVPWRLSVVRANLARTRCARLRLNPSEMTNDEHELQRSTYEHLFRAALLFLQPRGRVLASLPVMSKEREVGELRADCLHGGVIVTTAHLGVWELLPEHLAGILPERARSNSLIVYRPLHDAPLNDWLRRRRERSARIAFVPDRGSMGALRRSIENGGIGGLLCDQRPRASTARQRGADRADAKATHSIEVSLLGQACTLSTGLCKLHQCTGAPVWFAVLLIDLAAPEHRGRRLRLHLVRLAKRNEALPSATLAQNYARELTVAVAETPSQYLWLHRRWKDSD